VFVFRSFLQLLLLIACDVTISQPLAARFNKPYMHNFSAFNLIWFCILLTRYWHWRGGVFLRRHVHLCVCCFALNKRTL